MGCGHFVEMRIDLPEMPKGGGFSRHAEILALSDARCIMKFSMFKLIFWMFVLFLALSFFGISVQKIINSPAGQANLAYLLQLLAQFWQWLSLSIGHLGSVARSI